MKFEEIDWVKLVTLIVAVVIVGYVISMGITPEEKAPDHAYQTPQQEFQFALESCYAQYNDFECVAVANNNPNVCINEPETKQECEDKFYVVRSIYDQTDKCDFIQDDKFKSICKGVLNNDLEQCNNDAGCLAVINGDVSTCPDQFCQDTFNMLTAIKNNDTSVCNNLNFEDSIFCTALLTKNPILCRRNSLTCFDRVINETMDLVDDVEQFCDEVTFTDDLNERCISLMNQYKE